MDFDYIEALVTKCKNNDEIAKEKLAAEFRPLIYNISKKLSLMGIIFTTSSKNVTNRFLNLFLCTV